MEFESDAVDLPRGHVRYFVAGDGPDEFAPNSMTFQKERVFPEVLNLVPDALGSPEGVASE